MKFWIWTVAQYWWLWGAHALLAALVLGIFFMGLTNGFVSSDNLAPWLGILVVVAAIVGSSLWLRSRGHPGLAVFPLLLVLAPAVLTVVGSLLFSAVYFLAFLFGNGRVN